MNESSRKMLLESIRVLGGEFDYSSQSGIASLLLDPRTASLLEIDEYCTVDFNDNSSQGKISADIIQSKIESIASRRGSTPAVKLNLPDDIVWPGQKKAAQFISSHNGKVVFSEAGIMDQTYLVVYSRCSAVSDEKRTFLNGAAVNCSSPAVSMEMPAMLEKNLENLISRSVPVRFTVRPDLQMEKIISASLQHSAEAMLTDFRESIRKRMARDASRLYNYYHELYDAASNPSGRKKNDPQQVKCNLEAIRSEYAKKTDDLRVKYLTAITMEPLCAVQITTPCLVSFFDVFMGNKNVTRSIAWNPLTMTTDITVCDSCTGLVDISRVCRNLHWLCKNCYPRCPRCGRECCVICKPGGCNCRNG